MFGSASKIVAVTRSQLPRHPVNLLDLLARTRRVVAGDRFGNRSRFRWRSRCRAVIVWTHRVVERIGRRTRSTACTAASGRRSRRNVRGDRVISATTGTATGSRLRSTAGSAARGTASIARSRSVAAATATSTAGRGHRHHRSATRAATASARHRHHAGHHAHRRLWNPLPIIAGVDHRLVVAVHRGLVLGFGLLMSVTLSAGASGFLLASAVRLATAVVAVAASEFVFEFGQARTLSTAGVAASVAA